MQQHLNDGENGCTDAIENIFKGWTARFSEELPMEIVVTTKQTLGSGPSARVPRRLLLDPEFHLGAYVRSHIEAQDTDVTARLLDRVSIHTNITVPRSLLLQASFDRQQYAQPHLDAMRHARKACAAGAPYDGDEAITNPPVHPSSAKRWSISYTFNLGYTVHERLRDVKVSFALELMNSEHFDVAKFVGYHLSL